MKAAIYDTPIPNEAQVHNLEHGHIMVQYRDLPADEVAALAAIVTADAQMMVLAPYPSMKPRLALTAWGVHQACDGANAPALAAVRSFTREHRDKAPESIP